MKREIIFFGDMFERVKHYFAKEKILESGMMCFAKISSAKNFLRLIVKDYIIPGEKDYLQRTPTFIAYHPDFMKKVFGKCVDENMHLIDIHSHPFSKNKTQFSAFDDNSEQELGPYIAKYFRNMLLASVVVGADITSLDARIWSRRLKKTLQIDRIKIIGVDGMNIIPATNSFQGTKCRYDSETHHRTVLALGAAAQERYSTLNVGIVGFGGTGCITGELLARLPVNKIITIDPDKIEKSNNNRLLGSTSRDAQYCRPKVIVSRRELKQSNSKLHVIPIKDNFLNPEVQEKCKSLDIMFGCIDTELPRLALNRFCLAHGIPYFDLGSGAVAKDGKLSIAGGQVVKIVPHGNVCFHCGGFLDKGLLKLEVMSEAEKKASKQLNYLSGDVLKHDETPQPAIYAINMQTASNAMWLMMQYVSGDSGRIDGIGIDALNYSTMPWKHESERNRNCPVCGKEGIVGLGDEAPLMTNQSGQTVSIRLSKKSAKNNNTKNKESISADVSAEKSKGQSFDISA